MSIGPQLVPSAARPTEPEPRNWLPLAIAAAVVIVGSAVAFMALGRGKPQATVTPISTSPDAYSASLPINGLAMSESSNLAGGKVTYLDGHIVNRGNRVVNGVTVQILFRNVAHEVVQNETLPLTFIRTRDPYIDVEPVSAAPLKQGVAEDFRLIFDTVSNDWDGAYPEIRVVHVDTN